MAGIRIDERTGLYFFRPTIRGKRHYISLDTGDSRDAELLAGKIRERIWQFSRGMVTIPESDWLRWIRTGSTTAASLETDASLGSVISSYSDSRPDKSTADSTRATEDIHLRHLVRILGKSTPLPSIDPKRIRQYVEQRLGEEVRGSRVTGPTIRKELYVFRRVWRFAAGEGIVTGDPPSALVPKGKPKEPFRTFAEISRLSGKMPASRSSDLWESCVLLSSEIAEFLEFVRIRRPDGWLYPAVMACAYAGIRRSEWIRSRPEDWDLENGKLIVRERKRVHNKHGSLRTIDLHPDLVACIGKYLEAHPGGSVMFCDRKNVPISRDSAADRWRRLVANSKWDKINGWHTLRHSFASNLAASGVQAELIDRWMGHQTKEQRDRYRHFFPRETNDAISRLVYRTDDKRS